MFAFHHYLGSCGTGPEGKGIRGAGYGTGLGEIGLIGDLGTGEGGLGMGTVTFVLFALYINTAKARNYGRKQDKPKKNTQGNPHWR